MHVHVYFQASVDLAEQDWGISMLTLCPSNVDTLMMVTAGRGGLGAIPVSPSVPEIPYFAIITIFGQNSEVS